MRQATTHRTIFLPAPGEETGVMAASFYSDARMPSLVSIHTHISRSDTCDVAYHRASRDNSRHWSAPVEIVTGESRDNGMFRRHVRAGIADPRTNRFILFRNEAVLPTDHPLEGLLRWRIHYCISEDGGETYPVDEPLICKGAEFDAGHPAPGIWPERSALMLGDLTCVPLPYDDRLLLPCQTVPLGPDGQYINPGGGYTYHHALVLHGRWLADGGLTWKASAPVIGDPARTTRGMCEPTLGALHDGRLLMVLRGSNDAKPHLPGYRWAAYSDDGGFAWSTPEPWCDMEGNPIFSPSSCSQLLSHSNGALYWLGNISPANPHGNGPRYPIVLAQVDKASGRLIRETVQVIDDRQPGESPKLTLSNFFAREDRETGDILLHLSRFGMHTRHFWRADALVYRITVDKANPN